MIRNVGTLDRVLRFILAGLFIIYALAGRVSNFLSVILIIVSIILVITGLTGWCGIYRVLGISTIRKKQ